MLSPVLFNMYLNDLLIQLDPIVDGKLAYAEVKKVIEWCHKNEMKVNKKKSGIVRTRVDNRGRKAHLKP